MSGWDSVITRTVLDPTALVVLLFAWGLLVRLLMSVTWRLSVRGYRWLRR